MPPSSAGGTESCSATASASPKRMKRKQLFAIWMCQFVEGVHTTLPYALAVFLVRSMLDKEGQPPPSESTIGWTTGALASVWSLAQFFTSMFWGRVSDAGLGRKPLLALSAVSSGVSVIYFGTAPTLLSAALARLCGGSLNSTFVQLKCLIGEGAPAGGQSGPMSVLALAWGFGTIVGPALGALSRPCDGRGRSWVSRSTFLCAAAPDSSSSSMSSSPSSGGLFVRYPFLFPCVAASLLSAAAVVNATLVLEETLPSIVEKKRKKQEEAQRRQRQQALSRSLSTSTSASWRFLPRRESLRRVLTFSSPYALVGASALRNDGAGGGGGGGEGDVDGEMERGGVELSFSSSSTTTKATKEKEQGELSALLPQASAPFSSSSSSSSSPPPRTTTREQPRAPASAFAPSSSSNSSQQQQQQQPHPSAMTTTTTTTPTPAAASAAPSPPPPSLPWHQLRQVRLTLCGYGSVAFLYNLLDELVPIFASAAEKDGGLGWSPSQLAPPLAVGGVALIVWSQLGYSRLQRRVGTLRAARCGLAGMAPVCLLLAAPALVPRRLPPLARAASLSLLLVLRSCFANNAFTSSMVLVNEAAPRDQIGRVNGAGQTVASAVRALGPAMAGGLWGVSSSTALRPPFGSFLPFALVSVGLVAASSIYTKVSPPPGEGGAEIDVVVVEEYQLVSSSSSRSVAATATELCSSSSIGVGGVGGVGGNSDKNKKARAPSPSPPLPPPLLPQASEGGKGLVLFDEDGRIDDGSISAASAAGAAAAAAAAAAETAEATADASVNVVVVAPSSSE